MALQCGPAGPDQHTSAPCRLPPDRPVEGARSFDGGPNLSGRVPTWHEPGAAWGTRDSDGVGAVAAISEPRLSDFCFGREGFILASSADRSSLGLIFANLQCPRVYIGYSV